MLLKKSCEAALQKGNGQLAYLELSCLNSTGVPVRKVGQGDV
jgi:hypothetical protein